MRKIQFRTKVLAAILLSSLAVQATASMVGKSVTVDEIMYIAAGYYHLRTGDFEMNMTNPPLTKLLSAIPLLALDLELPPVEGRPRDWNIIAQWKFARSFLYHNRVDANTILVASRLPIVALSLTLGFFVFVWGRELYGESAALFSLFLYCFSPNILAHSRLATQDLGLTAFMFLSTYFFWQYLRGGSRNALILCGLMTGLAILTKTTALFLFVIFGLFSLLCVLAGNRLGLKGRLPLLPQIDAASARLRQGLALAAALFVIGLLSVATLNVGYGFQGVLTPVSDDDEHADFYERLPLNNAVTRGVADAFLESPLPVPRPFVDLMKFQFYKTGGAGDVYFAGVTSSSGWWYLMLVTILIKTPIPILILLGASVTQLVLKRVGLGPEWLMAIFISVLLFVFSYLSSVNSGLRYVLPIYPMLHLLAGRLLGRDFPKPQWVHGLVALLSGWYLLGTLFVHPHYLAYFNELVGGPRNGYKYLVDSNLDWGQDLGGLKRYVEEHKISRIKLGYFGSADARYYDLDYEYLPSVGLAPREPGEQWWYEMDQATRNAPLRAEEGVYAVSATLLGGMFFPNAYEWLRDREPTDHVGYSILIFVVE